MPGGFQGFQGFQGWNEPAASTAPIATNVRFSAIDLREGGSYTVAYDYDANGGDVEGTSTVSITIDDVEVATTFTGTIPGSSSGGVIAAIVTPVSTSESGSPVASIDYGPIGAAFTDTAVTIWPDTSISEGATSIDRVSLDGVLAVAGRTKTNAIRIWTRPSIETTTHATNAAAATFTDDGFNVLVVSLNTDEAVDLVMTDGFSAEFLGGFPGYSYLNPWWNSIINAICDAGRLDAIMMDFEGAILYSDAVSLPASQGGGAIKNEIRTLITAAAGDYSSFPGDLADSVWDNYLSQTIDTDAWFPYSAQVNDAVTAEVAASIESNLFAVARARNPGITISTYKRTDYTADQQIEGSTRLLINGKIGDASSPELYDDLTYAKGNFDNSIAPQHPWLTPTPPEAVDAKAFHALVDYVESQGAEHLNFWASDSLFIDRQTAAPLLNSPIAAYDLQEYSGTTHADRVGSNDGTHQGNFTVAVSQKRGPGGYFWASKEFDGVNNRVTLPNQPAFVYGPATGTWMAFVRADTSSGTLFAVASDSTNRRHIGIEGGFYRGNVAGSGYFGTAAIELGVWKHLALTWDDAAGTAQLYVNGVAAGSASSLTIAAAANVAIGQFGPGGNYWEGAIAGVRMFNTVLTQPQIAAHAAQAEPQIWESPTIERIGNQLFAQFRASDFNVAGHWEKDGVDIPGADKAVLTQQGAGDYQYVLDVTNDFGSTTESSAAVSITVSSRINRSVSRTVTRSIARAIGSSNF